MKKIAIAAGVAIAAVLVWNAAASVLWSMLTQALGATNPFSLFGWWQALSLWNYNLATKIVLLLAAAPPTFIIIPIATAYRNRRQIQGRLMLLRAPPAKPWSSHDPEMTHGDARFTSADDATRHL